MKKVYYKRCPHCGSPLITATQMDIYNQPWKICYYCCGIISKPKTDADSKKSSHIKL